MPGTAHHLVGMLPWTQIYGSPWPLSNGRIFYVHNFDGSNDNDGRDPAYPLLTITYALANRCEAGRDDYIIVLDAYNEATPIAVNIQQVHIIGLGTNLGVPWVSITATGNVGAIFTIGALCNYAEIAGFNFGGGPASAGIELGAGTPMGVHIHDCAFGHAFANDTPLDGILIAGNATALRIERCNFLGNAQGKGTLTRDGVRFSGAPHTYGGQILDCYAHGCPGVALNVIEADGMEIARNRIAYPTDTQGQAITLGAATVGCTVMDNIAMYGDATVVMAANPYLDSAAAAVNHWGKNYKGNVLVDPA